MKLIPAVLLFALSLSAAETLPIRINCGDGQTTNLDDNGQVITFFPDRNFTGGLEYRDAGSAGTDAGVQHTARYGPQFSYSFAVPNGSYIVRTWHRDPSATAAGQRLMSISANGAQAISFDIYKSVGLGIFKQSFTVAITTGNIALSFSGTPGTPLPNGMLNAIEIIPTFVISSPTVSTIVWPSPQVQIPGPMGPPGPTGATGPMGPAGAPGSTDPVGLAAAVASYLKANPIPAVDPAFIASAVATYMKTNPVQASGDPLAPLVAITRTSSRVLQVTYRGKSCSLTLDPLSRGGGARIALGDTAPLEVVAYPGVLIASSDPALCEVLYVNWNRYVPVADWGSSATGWDDPANPAQLTKVYTLPEILRIVAGGVCVCPGK